MYNVPRHKYAMKRYAEKHELEIPRVVWASPVWGAAARQLAWRVSGHAHDAHHKQVPQSAQLTHQLHDLLFPPTLPQIAVGIAKAEVGVTEHPAGSNSGPRVHTFQSATGAYGQPWCASFVTWCYETAAKRAGRTVRPAPIAAYVPSWTQMIRAGERGWRRVEPSEARAGDVVTLWGSQHIELVTGREDGSLLCVGGNTSPEGQNANGGMVARTRRSYGEVTVVGRLR